MLLYPQIHGIGFVGPHYFFACLFGAKIHLVTTEKDLTPVPSDLALAITPTSTMADTPRELDVLFEPGGTDGTLSVMGRADAMSWISDRASRAKYITSVCTGSMILAKAGILKGKKATSHCVARGGSQRDPTQGSLVRNACPDQRVCGQADALESR